jgi:hypothetical protein
VTRTLCFLVLLLGAANAGADLPSDSVTKHQMVVEAGRPAFSGYLADVEVSLGGVIRHGRIIVTRDGCVHLEHLDQDTVRWVQRVIRQEPSTPNGWDDRLLRAGPVRRVWCRLGQTDVLAEIHTPDGSLKISRHKLLSAR